MKNKIVALVLFLGAVFLNHYGYAQSSLALEAGEITLTPGVFVTINLQQSYDDPAVFLLEDFSNSDPSSVRIRNVTATSFEIVQVEPRNRNGNAADIASVVHYLVVEKGQHNFPDGTVLEVVTLALNNIQSGTGVAGGESWRTQNYVGSFSNPPTILAEVQTMNNEAGHVPGSNSAPWFTTAIRNVNSNSFQVALERSEVNDPNPLALVAEQVSYLAIERGVITDFIDNFGNTIRAEAQTTTDSIVGPACVNSNFLQAYATPPLVIGNKNRHDGNDGGWLRRCSLSTTNAGLLIDEDQFSNNERSHITESAGLMIFSESFAVDFDIEPIALWYFDESVWDGTADEVRDSFTGGLHGIALNGAQTSNVSPAIAGNPGTCNYGMFDGVDDYIEIADSPSLDIDDELTAMAWINISSLPSGSILKTFFSKDTNFEAHVTSSGAINWWWQTDAGAVRQITTTETISVGNWHHIAITYSMSSGAQRIYIDGVASGQSLSLTETLANNDLPFQIGQDQGIASRFFPGGIDEVRLFDTALNAGQVIAQMNQVRTCFTPPVADLRMDESSWSGAAGEVIDVSGNDYHATAIDTNTVPGFICNAADFSATGITDYLQLDSRALDGATDFTISAWVQTTSNGAQTLVSGARAGQANELLMFHQNQNRFNPFLKGSGNPGNIPASINNGNWRHVVWTREGTQNCYYIDDNLQGCVTRSAAPVSLAVNGLILGQEQDSVGGAFDPNQDWEGLVDELLVFDQALERSAITNIYNNQLAGNNWDGSPRSCSCDHGGYSISQPLFGLACPSTRAEVTITALCDDLITTKADYMGTAALSTNDNGNSIFYDAASGGAVITEVDFTSGTGSETAYLFYRNENTSVSVSAEDTATSVSSTSGSSTDFRTDGFDVQGPNNFICGNTETVTLTAIGQDDDGSAACQTLTGFNGPKDLKAWFTTRHDPLQPMSTPGASSTNLRLNATNISDSVAPTNNNLNGVNFTAGVAVLPVEYLDAAQIPGINFIHDDPPFGSTPGVPELVASTASFVVRPNAIALSAPQTNSDCASGDDACTAFRAAGEDFQLTVAAVCADSAASVAQSYQSIIPLSHTLVAPAGGNLGALSQTAVVFNDTTNGQVTINNQQINEVGVFSIAATPPNYFTETIASVTSANIGRFTPEHYVLSAGTTTEACSIANPFTYIGENFVMNYGLSAMNAAGAVTQNYRDGFVKIGAGGLSFGALDTITNTDYSADISSSLSTFTWIAGVGDVDSTFTLDRTNIIAPLALSVGVLPIDSDGITLLTADLNLDTNGGGDDFALIASTNQRYGRVFVENAFGPETRDLAVSAVAQYYDGLRFIPNVDDSCAMGNASLLGSLGVATITTPATSFISGEGSFVIDAPNVAGTVDTRLTVDSWLQFDWNGAGDVNPEGTATFGSYRGHDKIIYRREVNQVPP